MKIRYWGIIAVLVSLVMLAASIDLSGSGAGLGLRTPIPSPSSINGVPLLTVCAPSQPARGGQLIPGQGTPSPALSYHDIVVKAAIPPDAWSSRVGFSISSSTDSEYWAQMLGSGWYLDWTMRSSILVNGPQHWQMVRVHEDCITPSPESIQKNAASFPGQIWIIGNEPDVIWQDNVTPTVYAIYYHELYKLIKSSDPSSLIAVGGIAQATPLRLQYLDLVLQTYQDLYHESLPADWWTVHGYVLREEKGSWGVDIPPGMDASKGELYEVSDHGRLDLFENQLRAFRKWMKDHGYQATPLALTEFGILMPTSYGFTPESIADYLEYTFIWLYDTQDETIGYPNDSYHLVQKWAWFSVSDPNYSSSDLGDLPDGQLTLVGERFRTMISKKGH